MFSKFSLFNILVALSFYGFGYLAARLTVFHRGEYYQGTELLGPVEAKANPRADYITKVDQPRGSGWEYRLFFPLIYLEEALTYEWYKANRSFSALAGTQQTPVGLDGGDRRQQH